MTPALGFPTLKRSRTFPTLSDAERLSGLGGCEFSVRRRRARCVRVTGHLTGSLENDGRRLSNQNSTDLPTAGFLTSLIGRDGYLRLTPALWNVVPRGRSAPERELRAEQGPLELGSCSGMTDSGVDLAGPAESFGGMPAGLLLSGRVRPSRRALATVVFRCQLKIRGMKCQVQ